MFKRDNYLQKYWTRVNYLNLSQIFLCSVCWNLLCIKKSISFFVWCLSLKGVKHSDTRLLPQYFQIKHHSLHKKMKFSFSKCDQIRSFLRVWSHLRKKSLMENFIFSVVIFSDAWENIINQRFRVRGNAIKTCYGREEKILHSWNQWRFKSHFSHYAAFSLLYFWRRTKGLTVVNYKALMFRWL